MFNFIFNQAPSIDWTTVIISIASAVIGALIAGLFSWLATKQAHEHNIELEELKEKEAEKRIVMSIKAEIKGIKDIYEPEINELHDGQRSSSDYYIFYFDVNPHLKTIYDNNSDKIGLINNENLRNKIIKCYIILNNYIGNLNLYRKMLDELVDVKKKFLTKYDNEYIVSNLISINSRLKKIKNRLLQNADAEKRQNIESFYNDNNEYEIDMVNFSGLLDKTYEQLKNISNEVLEQIDQIYKE